MAETRTPAEKSAEQAQESARAAGTEETTTRSAGRGREAREAGRPRFEGIGGAVSDEDRLSGPTHADDATYLGTGTATPTSAEASVREGGGPEDALGVGPKRGDYEGMYPEGYEPTEVVALDSPDEQGRTAVVVPQKPRASDQGDEEGKKGGVETATPEAVEAEAKEKLEATTSGS